jgi:hypothetical protein
MAIMAIMVGVVEEEAPHGVTILGLVVGNISGDVAEAVMPIW